MAITIDATVGGSAANSYWTLANALEALAGRSDAATFIAEEDDEVQKDCLVRSTNWLQRRIWKGERVNDIQRLAHPRFDLPKPDSPTGLCYPTDEVAEPVMLAQLEAMLGCYNGEELDAAGGDGITSFSAGKVQVSYARGGGGQGAPTARSRALELLRGLLGPPRIVRA